MWVLIPRKAKLIICFLARVDHVLDRHLVGAFDRHTLRDIVRFSFCVESYLLRVVPLVAWDATTTILVDNACIQTYIERNRRTVVHQIAR